MDSLLAPPSATAFDAVSALLSASAYILVALAAIAGTPRVPRARVFLAVAISSAAPYCLTALIWRDGGHAVWSKAVVITVSASLLAGSLALFHFTQVFPWRRPWIRAHGRWLWLAYAVVALATVLAIAVAPAVPPVDASGGLGAVSPEFTALIALVILAVLVPGVLVFGIVVPFAGLLSLYKSYLTARAKHIAPARLTTVWMLISQMGGGVLTILIVPLLRVIAPRGPWVTIGAALLFGFSLLMPLAFAVGVFKLRVLDLPIDALPQ